jgi:hypothetical protein
VMTLGLLELRSKQRRRDAFTLRSVIAAQPDLQGAGHRAFRLAGIRALVLSAITPPDAQG